MNGVPAALNASASTSTVVATQVLQSCSLKSYTTSPACTARTDYISEGRRAALAAPSILGSGAEGANSRKRGGKGIPLPRPSPPRRREPRSLLYKGWPMSCRELSVGMHLEPRCAVDYRPPLRSILGSRLRRNDIHGERPPSSQAWRI